MRLERHRDGDGSGRAGGGAGSRAPSGERSTTHTLLAARLLLGCLRSWLRGCLLGCLPGCLLGCLLVLAVMQGAALAQGEAGESGDVGGSSPTPPATSGEAPADSLAGGEEPAAAGGQATGGDPGGATQAPTSGFGGFHPAYQSKFDINRNTRTWTQSISFNTNVQKVQLNNSTSVAIGEDTSLGRNQRNRNTTTSLSYSIRDNLKMSGSLGFTRNLTEDTRTRTQQSTDRLSGKVDYNRALVGGVNGVFVADFGTQRDSRDDPLTSDRESNGPYAQASADLDLRGDTWNWTFNTRVRRSSLTSREALTGTTTDDRNINADVGFSLSWDLPGLAPLTFNVNRDLTRTQQPFNQNVQLPEGGFERIVVQETSRQVQRGFSLDTGASPLDDLDLTARFTFRNNDINREIDLDRSQESIDRTFNSTLAYVLPDSSRMTAKYDWGVQRSLFDAEARAFLNGDVVSNALSGTFDRAIGRRTKLSASGNYQLQSYLFDDTEANLDDRDVVRGDFAATADYEPSSEIDTSLRFSVQHSETIFIDGSKSSGNTSQQTYTINPRFSWQLTPRVTFREDGSVIAIAKIFPFNEDRNTLSRTTELRSSILATLHRRLDGELQHVHRIVQNGSFRRDPEDGVRKFGQASESITRDLSLRFDYTPMTGAQVFFRVNKRFGDTTSRTQQGGAFFDVVSESEFTEIEMGGNLNHTMKNGVRIGSRIRRVQNWNDRDIRNNWFVGDISVSRTF